MHFYIVIEDCYNRIYSWPWVSSIKRNEAIPVFLLRFFLIIEFSLSSYSSSTCANLSMYLLRCEGNAATSLPRNPTVQRTKQTSIMKDKDHDSGGVWQYNIYGEVVLFTVLALPCSDHREKIAYEGFNEQTYEWWISEIMKSTRFAIFEFFISWQILAAFQTFF